MTVAEDHYQILGIMNNICNSMYIVTSYIILTVQFVSFMLQYFIFLNGDLWLNVMGESCC